MSKGHPQGQYWMALGIAVGAGFGAAVGVLVSGGGKLAVGIALGAGVGGAAGAVADNRCSRQSH